MLGSTNPGVEEWSPSRRTAAGLLSGASILSSRAAGDLLSTAVELLDVGIAALTVYQTAVGGGLLGDQLSWLFAGYLVYAYTPELYSDFFGDVVEERGFRAITATVAVYYGVVWGSAIGVLPDRWLFGIVQRGGLGPLLPTIAGLVGGLLAFGSYVHVIRNERFTDPDGELFGLFEAFSPNAQQVRYEQIETLSRPARSFVDVVTESTGSIFLLLPATLLGVVLAAVTGFSPLPELLVLLGVVLGSPSVGGRLPARWPSESTADVELRSAEGVTRAFRNSKGLILTFWCFLGLAACAMTFFVGAGVVAGTVGRTFALGGALVDSGGLPLSAVPTALTYVWLVVAITMTPLVYGVYGLVYWLRQLKRLAPYAEFWEQYWRGVSRERSPPSTTRPSGLFLQGDALLVLYGVFLWLPLDTMPTLVLAGCCLVWSVVVALVARSLLAAARDESQPLDNEGRDVTVAVVLQLLSIVVLGSAVGVEARYVATFGIGVVVLVAVTYLPDVTLYAERRVGVVSYLGVVYVGFIAGLLLLAGEVFATVPTAIYAFFAICFAVWAPVTYLFEKAESLHGE